jgi:hypothetical protein
MQRREQILDILEAERLADRLIATEIAKQDELWGKLNERPDTSKGQLMRAGMAQLDALYDRHNGAEDSFDPNDAPMIYPEDWSGFRDYGSDMANLVVTKSFLPQEVKRKLLNGEDHTRLARRPDQAYDAETGLPNVIPA